MIRPTIVRAAVDAAARVSGHHLRVIAYHGVDDLDAFARQLGYLREFWNPVSTTHVLDVVRGSVALEPRSVWITFDDGLRSTLVDARRLLDGHGISAVAFVNPGVVTETRTQWWDTVTAAAGQARVSDLKRIPDHERRLEVEAAERHLQGRSLPDSARTGTLAEIEAWVAAGHSVGNHTWDHPMLDQCSADEQRRQIERAHGWLDENGLMREAIFAYPNGDWTPVSERCLADLGYEVALLFDHKLTSTDRPLRMSRLRVDSSADVERLSVILSGMHTGAFAVARKLGIRR